MLADPCPAPPPPQVAVCALCHVARAPLVALVHEGHLYQACQPCWAFRACIDAMARLPVDSAEIRGITDAAMTVYQMTTSAAAPADGIEVIHA